MVSYLTSLYHSVAETLPDVRDSTDADEDVTAQGLLVDPYAIELGKRADAESVKDHSGSRPVQAKVKQAKPRKMKRGVLLNQDRVASDAADGKEVRYLPPGMMKDCEGFTAVIACQILKEPACRWASVAMKFAGILGTVPAGHT